jgi:hypothetical protein
MGALCSDVFYLRGSVPSDHPSSTSAKFLATLVLALWGCPSGSDAPQATQAVDTTAWCLTGSASVPVVFRIPPNLISIRSVYGDTHHWGDPKEPVIWLDFEITPEPGEPDPHVGNFPLVPFHTRPKRGYHRWEETIDGRRARLVTYSRYGRAVAIAKIPLDSTRWVQLTMIGQQNHQPVKAELPAIARTLRFGRTFTPPEKSRNAAACPNAAVEDAPPTKTATP